MTNNKDLFKQAIAEAKSVREAAITNAKDALEETVTPHLKDMLATKLQEMNDDDMEEEVDDQQMHDDDDHEIEDDSEQSDDEMEDHEEEEEVEDMSVEQLKDLIKDIVAQEMGEEESEEEIDGQDMVDSEDEEQEEIDLDELLSELDQEVEEGSANKMKKDEMEEGHFSGDQSDIAGAAGGLDNIVKAFEKLLKKGGQVGKKAQKELEQLAAANASVRGSKGSSMFESKSQLKEAVKTIKKLRTELNEVNVFNAKLLYLNKILKASNLKESQKVNIIAAFDNAETVKEAKLIYNTVRENTSKSKDKNNRVLESRLGRASKPTGTTATKPNTITESSQTVKRMQKLAGII